MSHNTIEMCKSYYENPIHYKYKRIERWKEKGVIHHDFDDLYDTYFKTMECQYCNKPFKKSINRHLDHNHETGAFRMIVCCACNSRDSHLKYSPDLTPREKQLQIWKRHRDSHKDERNASKRTRLNCFFCSKELSRNSLTRHYQLGRCIIKPN